MNRELRKALRAALKSVDDATLAFEDLHDRAIDATNDEDNPAKHAAGHVFVHAVYDASCRLEEADTRIRRDLEKHMKEPRTKRKKRVVKRRARR